MRFSSRLVVLALASAIPKPDAGYTVEIAVGMGDFHVPCRFGILAFEGPPEPRALPVDENSQRLESKGAPH